MNRYDVIVIGGGPAGMTAAITAAENGARVLLCERGRPGHKLSITGKGRCNLTNCSDIEDHINSIPAGGKFLYSALAGFSAYDTMAFFEALGVPLKVERGGRVFPCSDKASDIVNALISRIKELGADLAEIRVREITAQDGRVTGISYQSGQSGKIRSEKVILATGGLSYPKTGSTGDGYKMAAALGHTVITPRAALVPICTKDDCRDMMGLSLKNVTLTLKDKAGKTLFSQLGEMLFTHFGISGPLALTASCYIKDDEYTVDIDLKPALTREKLDSRILRDFESAKNKQAANVMRGLLPQSIIMPVLKRAGISPSAPINTVTKVQRDALISVLKCFRLSVSGLRPIDEAIITDGGISLKEIDPKTMESRIVRGLYFAGEIIDCMAVTGGYNLQIAFSTGRAAGRAVL